MRDASNYHSLESLRYFLEIFGAEVTLAEFVEHELRHLLRLPMADDGLSCSLKGHGVSDGIVGQNSPNFFDLTSGVVIVVPAWMAPVLHAPSLQEPIVDGAQIDDIEFWFQFIDKWHELVPFLPV